MGLGQSTFPQNHSSGLFENKTAVSDMRSLQRGDHIIRKIWFNGIDHHGIYLGNDRVAHFYHSPGATGKSAMKNEGSIRIDNIDVFADGKQVFVAKHRKTKFREEIARTAEHCARDPTWFGNYNLLTNNCQHFAYYCVTGQRKMTPFDSEDAQFVSLMPPGVVLTNREHWISRIGEPRGCF
uniref:LRAT domain-containing protein n=1 Tax=Panagrellus redivivus TaxID=6233 RepID=A0A7E4WA85_PANRE